MPAQFTDPGRRVHPKTVPVSDSAQPVGRRTASRDGTGPKSVIRRTAAEDRFLARPADSPRPVIGWMAGLESPGGATADQPGEATDRWLDGRTDGPTGRHRPGFGLRLERASAGRAVKTQLPDGPQVCSS